VILGFGAGLVTRVAVPLRRVSLPSPGVVDGGPAAWRVSSSAAGTQRTTRDYRRDPKMNAQRNWAPPLAIRQTLNPRPGRVQYQANCPRCAATYVMNLLLSSDEKRILQCDSAGECDHFDCAQLMNGDHARPVTANVIFRGYRGVVAAVRVEEGEQNAR